MLPVTVEGPTHIFTQ